MSCKTRDYLRSTNDSVGKVPLKYAHMSQGTRKESYPLTYIYMYLCSPHTATANKHSFKKRRSKLIMLRIPNKQR